MSLSVETSKLFVDFALAKIEKLDKVYQEFYDYTVGDLNSSKIREEITLKICGYDQVPGKLGYDGVFGEKFKEVKPKLFTGKTNSGNGNFSDLTISNLEKKYKDNIDVIVSYFAHGRVIYVMELPFETIYEKLYKQVYEKCVNNENKYCRSANFSYKDYIDSPSLKIKYINWDLIHKYDKIINRQFLKKLKERHGIK